MINPNDTVKINRNCYSAFFKELNNSGINWMLNCTETCNKHFTVILTTSSRAMIDDGSNRPFFCSKSVLLKA